MTTTERDQHEASLLHERRRNGAATAAFSSSFSNTNTSSDPLLATRSARGQRQKDYESVLSLAVDDGADDDDAENALLPRLSSMHSAASSSSSSMFFNIKMSEKNVGRLLLFVVSFLYGTLNVTLRLVYALPDPPSASALSTFRGWLAVLCFTPFLAQKQQQQATVPVLLVATSEHHDEPVQSTTTTTTTTTTPNNNKRPLWMMAFELAVWNFGAQALVNISLKWIPSARASFLTETSVVITPVVSAIAGHPVKWTVWLACAVAMGGLVILSDNDQGVGHFGFGDMLTLLGALCWSFYVFRLSGCGDYDEVNMQALKTTILACLYSVWYGAASLQSDVPLWAGIGNVVAWLLLFYSALGPGTVADIIQQAGQAKVSAAEANVIIAMEPVFTSVLGFMLLGEAMTVQEYLGGGLLIIAAVLATR